MVAAERVTITVIVIVMEAGLYFVQKKKETK